MNLQSPASTDLYAADVPVQADKLHISKGKLFHKTMWLHKPASLHFTDEKYSLKKQKRKPNFTHKK